MSIDTPIFRLVARNSGDPSSGLRVEATYALLGLVRTKTVSTVYGGSDLGSLAADVDGPQPLDHRRHR